MPKKEISDAELDKMIDQSVKNMKGEKDGSKRRNDSLKQSGKAVKPADKAVKPEAGKDGSSQSFQAVKSPKETKGKKVTEKKEAKRAEPTKRESKEVKKEAKEEKDTKEPKKEPAAPAPAIKGEEGFDAWKILHYPHLAEKSMNLVELENKLVFIVRRDANKSQIKEAIEKGFGVKVLSVNVTITRKGHKKAYIKLAPDFSAADIATRLGMI